MSFKDRFFKQKEETTLRELLGNDAVKGVVEDFIRDSMPSAEGVIIIWAAKGNLFIDCDGLSEAEIMGSLHMMGHKIEHEGVPR